MIGHGSKLEENSALVLNLANGLQRTGRFGPVVPCFMQINEPDVPTGLRTLISMGVDVVYVQPCFLAGGVHISKDIPQVLGMEEGSKHGTVNVEGVDVKLRYCQPIGYDERLVDILGDRVKARME